MKETKSVFIIVREFPSVKARVLQRSIDRGFSLLSDYIRDLYEKDTTKE